MNVSFTCPQCEHAGRAEIDAGRGSISCSRCGHEFALPADGLDGGRLRRCLLCPSADLFVRKDFPQRWGVALVAVGIVGSSIAWAYNQPVWTFAILFASALADFVLYAIVGRTLSCYRCHAEYRDVEGLDEHGGFNLETHERYRQMNARLAASSGGPPRPAS